MRLGDGHEVVVAGGDGAEVLDGFEVHGGDGGLLDSGGLFVVRGAAAGHQDAFPAGESDVIRLDGFLAGGVLWLEEANGWQRQEAHEQALIDPAAADLHDAGRNVFAGAGAVRTRHAGLAGGQHSAHAVAVPAFVLVSARGTNNLPGAVAFFTAA